MKLYDETEDRFYTGRIVALIAAVLVGLTAVSLGVYALTYATADTRGRIALHNQQRDPVALQFNYEYFHNTCHDIIAKTQQIATLQAQVDNEVAHPPANDPFGQYQSRVSQDQANLAGLKNIRDSVAQDYNSKSHQFTRGFIKSKDLPAEIGPPNGVPYVSLVCENQPAGQQ